MRTQNYQQLIIEGIKGLPPETLAEIADFIFFLRKRTFQPQAFIGGDTAFSAQYRIAPIEP